jgi:hypothetical protein
MTASKPLTRRPYRPQGGLIYEYTHTHTHTHTHNTHIQHTHMHKHTQNLKDAAGKRMLLTFRPRNFIFFIPFVIMYLLYIFPFILSFCIVAMDKRIMLTLMGGGWHFSGLFFLLSLKDAVDKRILLTLGGLAILASVPLFLRRRVERSLEQVWCKGGRGCA